MSADWNCPFCDSSDERHSERTPESWENTSRIIADYFLNFTLDHFNKLCDSCFTYIYNFYKCRKLWFTHEKMINEKRQLGQFKGLKDIVHMKKDSSLICRLCFKQCNTEDVIFIYLENEIYQPGYIKNIMALHVNDIDLRMTENPVICQECLDAIQTFDALYQMCLENQAGKAQPQLKLKSAGNHDDLEKVVHIQLKKNSKNLLVLHSISEAENAVNTLIKSKESPGSSVVMNGWTTKKVYDIFHNPKSKKKVIKKPDICIISDEDEMGNKSSKETTNVDSTCDQNLDLDDNISADNLQCSEKKIEHCINRTLETEHSDIIEIEDSDEEPSRLPKIVNVSSMNELELTMETREKHTSDTPGHMDEDCEEINEINMETQSLFSEPTTIIEGSETTSDFGSREVTSDENSSNSNNPLLVKNQTKDLLEENLSDFLQFNKNSNSNFLENDSSLSNGKRRKLYTINQNEDIQAKNAFSKDKFGTYSTVFENFVMDQESRISAWKLLRGSIAHNFKDDEYCAWFPFYPQDKKYYQSTKRKCTVTAIENKLGSRLYRCNVCLYIMKEESHVDDHHCKIRGKRSRVCIEPKCSFYTFNDFLFSQHKKAHSLLSFDNIQDYKCPSCDFYSSDKEHMTNHRKKFHETGRLEGVVAKCRFCFFQSMNPDILEHHISVRHSRKKTKFTEKYFG